MSIKPLIENTGSLSSHLFQLATTNYTNFNGCLQRIMEAQKNAISRLEAQIAQVNKDIELTQYNLDELLQKEQILKSQHFQQVSQNNNEIAQLEQVCDQIRSEALWFAPFLKTADRALLHQKLGR